MRATNSLVGSPIEPLLGASLLAEQPIFVDYYDIKLQLIEIAVKDIKNILFSSKINILKAIHYEPY